MSAGDPSAYRLMSRLGFDHDDLRANRAGQLTRRQLRRQGWRVVRETLPLAAILAVVLVAALLLRDVVEPAWGSILLAVLAGLALLAWIAWVIGQIIAITRDADHVQAESGPLSAYYLGSQPHPALRQGQPAKQSATWTLSPVHQLNIGQQRFRVYGHVRDVFMTGEHYTVYYLPATKRIVSAVRIEPPSG